MLKGFKVIGEYSEESKSTDNGEVKRIEKPSYHYPRRDTAVGGKKRPDYRTAASRKAAAEERARSAAVDAEVLERRSQEWVAEASEDFIESRNRHRYQSGFGPENDDEIWQRRSGHQRVDSPSIDPMRYTE